MGSRLLEVIESQHVSLDGARKFGLAAAIFVVLMTAFGLVAPTFVERLDAATVRSEDWASWLGLGAAVVYLVVAIVVSVEVGTKAVDRLRPSAAPADFDRLLQRRPSFSYMFAYAIVVITYSDPSGFPTASGLHAASDQEGSWLRVVAPADFSYAVIAYLLIFTIALAAAVVLKWGWGIYASSLATPASADAARAEPDI